MSIASLPTWSPRPDSDALSWRVYDHVLRQLLGRTLVPGQILNRRQTASELGVSVAPVLEAFVRLERDGLLESLPSKGTRVRLIRTEDLEDQRLLREALECQGARLYCGQPLRENYDRLVELAQRTDTMEPNTMEDFALEIELHAALMELSGSAALLEAFRRAIGVVFFITANLAAHHPPSTKRNRHVKLLRDLRTPDPDQAERVMRLHLRG